MLSYLRYCELWLPQYIEDPRVWRRQKVTERDLTFDRVWRPLIGEPFGDADIGWRLYIHRIPPNDGEAFFHPHPWPMAVHVLGPGKYQMGLGFGPPVGFHGVDYEKDAPATSIITHAPAGYQYELLDAKVWHYIRALDAEVYSLMVTAPGFNSVHHEPDRPALDCVGPDGVTERDLIAACKEVFSRAKSWFHE